MGTFFLASCLVAIALLFCSSDVAAAKDWCPLPSELKSNYDFNWSTKSNEWINKTAKTSYLLLILSWTPTFCESLTDSARAREFQCLNQQHFDLVVHGLWPQASKAKSIQDHPRNCLNDKQLNSTFIKRYFCMSPDEDLIQSEWEKHGTCHYKTATEYYSTIERLYTALKIPDIQSIKNPTISSIKDAFLEKNSKLFASAIYVAMSSNNRLKEIRFCYNLNYQFTSCNA